MAISICSRDSGTGSDVPTLCAQKRHLQILPVLAQCLELDPEAGQGADMCPRIKGESQEDTSTWFP